MGLLRRVRILFSTNGCSKISEKDSDQPRTIMQIDTGDEEERSIDLAPLLDCIFLLLIFFMITASFKTDTLPQLDIPLELPRVSDGLAAQFSGPIKALEISIGLEGELHLNAVECELSDLHRILKSDALINPERKVIIVGDRRVAFEYVARVMSLCHLLGLQNVTVKAERNQ